MNGRVRFGDLEFDESFLFARRSSGEQLKFTRSERAILLAFSSNPRRVMTRDHLLDAVSSVGSESTDRNIDLIVNRLRGKLGDSARNPTWIATQYGEGYIWIAKPADVDPRLEAFLVFGPVRGLAELAPGTDASLFLHRLEKRLAAELTPDQRVIVVPEWRPETGGPYAVDFQIEMDFRLDDAGLHCAIVLRDPNRDLILRSLGLVICPDGAEPGADSIESTVAELKASIWSHLNQRDNDAAALNADPL
jgi:DNA-binding winged helix-turn-helix (wHTH) protein